MIITYPSEVVPGPPTVTLDKPEGWEVVETPAAQIAVRKLVEPAKFAANVIVEITTYGLEYDLEVATAALDAAIDELDQVEDIGRTTVNQGGLPAYVREFAHVDERAGGLVQNTRVIVAKSGTIVTVVQVTGSASANSLEADLQQVRDIADSVTVTNN